MMVADLVARVGHAVAAAVCDSARSSWLKTTASTTTRAKRREELATLTGLHDHDGRAELGGELGVAVC